ncbi:MAG: hypothetical protein ACI8XO_003655 [Verrucomicrobiales bacterium]
MAIGAIRGHRYPITMNRILLPALIVFTFSSFSTAAITSVVVGVDKVTITGNAAQIQVPAPPLLREVLPHGELSESIPYQNQRGTFEAVIPRRTASGYDRIYSSWALGGALPVYATDVSEAAAHPGLKPMVAKNRKGVGGIHPAPELFPDLVELGVGHITVNILLRQKFSQGQVQSLDRLLTFAHENGIVVSAILLVPPRTPVLAHPDCDPAAQYALPDMTSAAGAEAFAGCVRYLAERYCKPGFPHGRISHWIVGNEVDAGWVWTNAGEKTASDYMDEYQRALRVAYYSVRSFDPHGRVFISLTHHWNSSHQPDPKRFYKPRHLLNLLNEHSGQCGDFEWGVAFHPYPDDLFNPRTWEDKKAHANFDTPLITMKNIEQLDLFLRQPPFLYRGKTVRSVLLSEQGYHTANRKPDAEKLQAAAIVYAWRNMKPLESIEAFHYHRWIDHEREGGLNLGLWTVRKGTETWPERKKQSWRVFQALGTPAEAKASAFANEFFKE